MGFSDSPIEASSVIVVGATLVVVAITGLLLSFWRKATKNRTMVYFDFSNKLDLVRRQSRKTEDGFRKSRYSSSDYIDSSETNLRTHFDVFLKGKETAGENGRCIGVQKPNKKYQWFTYEEVYRDAHAFGSTLKQKGIERQGFLGIYAPNLITRQSADLPYRAKDIDTEIGDDLLKRATKLGVECTSFSSLLSAGLESRIPVEPPEPGDLYLICYTSGTTGNPKGVMLQHRNIVSNLLSSSTHVDQVASTNEKDVYLSFLPMAHVFEQIMTATMFYRGGSIGIYGGDPAQLLNDMQLLKPTIWATVPRVLNRIYDKVLAGVQKSKLKAMLFKKAIEFKEAELNKGIIRNTSFWDVFVLAAIQNMIGGRVKLIVTGSAPLGREVVRFCRTAFGCAFIEGYGQTEASAACTVTYPFGPLGDVGAVLSCNVIKLADVEEMGYFARENRGEVCIRGSNTMVGYFKDPEKTKETIDENGWLHTGDIGEWTPNGALRIIDRKKHIFKLSQGEYVAPEKIEQVYTRSKFVAQCFVDGNSLHNYVVAVVVPDAEVLVPWAKAQGLLKDEWESTSDQLKLTAYLCAIKRVQDTVFQDMIEQGKQGNLNSLEQVKAIHLEPEPFTVENGLLTPTFKSRRPQLRSYYKPIVEKLYDSARSNIRTN